MSDEEIVTTEVPHPDNDQEMGRVAGETPEMTVALDEAEKLVCFGSINIATREREEMSINFGLEPAKIAAVFSTISGNFANVIGILNEYEQFKAEKEDKMRSACKFTIKLENGATMSTVFEFNAKDFAAKSMSSANKLQEMVDRLQETA